MPLCATCAGVISGLVSRLVTFPADTLKARLQVAGALQHGGAASASTAAPASSAPLGTPPQQRRHTGRPSTAAAARLLWAKEGPHGFFRGFGAVVLGAAPAQAVYFGGYELGRQLVPPGSGIAGDMAVGCIAQVIAGTAFTPVDIVKERLQVHSPPSCHHACALHAARTHPLWRTSGRPGGGVRGRSVVHASRGRV